MIYIQLFLGFIFFSLGSFFLLIFCSEYLSFKKFNDTSLPVDVFVTESHLVLNYNSDDEHAYQTFVTYTIDGIEYYSDYFSDHKIHDNTTVTVYYNRDNPIDLYLQQNYISSPALILLGVILFIIGIFMLYKNFLRFSNISKLKSKGIKIYAKIISIERDMHISVNDEYCLFKIVSEYYDEVTSIYYTFVKTHVNGSDLSYDMMDKEILVFVDPNNFKNYHIGKIEIKY